MGSTRGFESEPEHHYFIPNGKLFINRRAGATNFNQGQRLDNCTSPTPITQGTNAALEGKTHVLDKGGVKTKRIR